MKTLYNILVVLLLYYVYLADITIYFTNLYFLKSFLAVCCALLILIYITLQFKSLRLKTYVFIPALLLVVFVFFWRDSSNMNLYYTAIWGVILIQRKDFTLKVFKYIFWLQFVAIFYEFFTHNLLYVEIATGTLGENNFDYNVSIANFDNAGFRPKGLFPGSLVATAFSIYSCFLFSKHTKMLFAAFLMAVMLNGRMALIVTLCTLLYGYLYNVPRAYRYNYFGGLLLITPFFIFLGMNLIPEAQLAHYAELLDYSNPNHMGRISRYVAGIIEYVFEYDVVEKLLGNPFYELYDQWGRAIPPESEFVGMLLEIGLVGFIFYCVSLRKAWRNVIFMQGHDVFLNCRYVLFWLIVCMIQYRHVLGNQRGTLFWFIVLLIIDKHCKSNEKSISC